MPISPSFLFTVWTVSLNRIEIVSKLSSRDGGVPRGEPPKSIARLAVEMAGDEMVLFNLDKRRLLVHASLMSIGAAGPEPATGWRVHRAGNLTANHVFGPF